MGIIPALVMFPARHHSVWLVEYRVPACRKPRIWASPKRLCIAIDAAFNQENQSHDCCQRCSH